MKLKEYLEGMVKDSPTVMFAMGSGLYEQMLNLETVGKYFELMFGIELQIEVKSITRPEGRFYGRGLVDELENQLKSKNLF